jgi:putative peptidoglycan lipid II flippase
VRSLASLTAGIFLVAKRVGALSLFRSLSTVGLFTGLSRVLGFVRDLVLAHTFGANAFTDAFFVAFKIPNFLRRLFAEGAFATAFVPVFTEYKEKRNFAQLKDLIDHVAGSLALVLLVVSAIGVIAAPFVVSLFALGWVMDGEQTKLALATEMLRLTFPYLFFISLTAFAGGIMNAYNRFAVPAFTPVLLNLSLIGCALWLSPQMEQPIVALAWGVLLAGISQFVFQVPYLRQLKLLPKPKVGFKHEGVKRILKLMLPALFAVSVTQINLLLDTVLASFLTTGSISWLYYSDRLMEFPLGVLGVALATVLLPKLSQQRAQDDPQGFTRSLDWGLRMVLLFGLPAALGLALLAGPMIATLFMSDVFTAHDVQMARLSLMAYSSGLLAFIFIKVLAPAYYAQQDTRTPVKIGVIAMLANMALNLALIYPLQHAGLALATSLSAYLNAFLLWRGLRQRGLYTALPGWTRLLVQVALASLAMGALLLYAPPVLDDWLGQTVWFRVGQLLLWVTLAAVVYFAVLRGSGLKFADLKIKKVES